MITKSKDKLFWQLQIAGWMTLLLIYIALYYRNNLSDINVSVGLSLTYLSGFLVTLVLRKFYKFIGYRNRSFKSISIIILFSTIVTANMWSLLDAGLSLLILENVRSVSELNFNRYLSWVWSNSTIIILWSTLYFGIKLWNDWLEAKSRAEKSDALAHKAQLQMLRYQLNPHFLFNSLNSIRALVDEDKLRAKSMITELSEFLRYSLVNKNLVDVTLNEELEAIRHYFEIEKTRFEEKLEVTFQIDIDTEKIKIPSFLIHPIIENAIKYGMKTTKLPLRINIKSELNLNWLNIEICNSGEWVENSETNISTGTGLENVKQRLENAYPNNNRFEIIKNNDRVCVIISIPIKNEE